MIQTLCKEKQLESNSQVGGNKKITSLFGVPCSQVVAREENKQKPKLNTSLNKRYKNLQQKKLN